MAAWNLVGVHKYPKLNYDNGWVWDSHKAVKMRVQAGTRFVHTMLYADSDKRM